MRRFIRSTIFTALVLAWISDCKSTFAELATFEVRPRPVSEFEIAGGAPAGTVYDLFTTSPSDILSVAFSQLEGDFYHSQLGNDITHPHSRVVEADPAATADSFFTTPGDTMVIGNGFALESGQETLWGDLSNDGPVTDFQFGRVTVPVETTARLDGSFSIRGEHGPERYPFQFSVDDNGTLIWGMVELEQPTPNLEPLPETTPVPEIEETPVVVVIPPTEAEVEPINVPSREEIAEIINEVTTSEDPAKLKEPTDEVTLPPGATIPIVQVIDWTDWVIDPIDFVYAPAIINIEDLVADLVATPEILLVETIDPNLNIGVVATETVMVRNRRLSTNGLQALDGGANLVFTNDAIASTLESVVPEPQSVGLMLLAFLGVSTRRLDRN